MAALKQVTLVLPPSGWQNRICEVSLQTCEREAPLQLFGGEASGARDANYRLRNN